MKSNFYSDVAKLERKYPEYVIDVWAPQDIQSVAPRKLTKKELRETADTLRHRFDAGIGINWDVIGMAVDGVIKSCTSKKK